MEKKGKKIELIENADTKYPLHKEILLLFTSLEQNRQGWINKLWFWFPNLQGISGVGFITLKRSKGSCWIKSSWCHHDTWVTLCKSRHPQQMWIGRRGGGGGVMTAAWGVRGNSSSTGKLHHCPYCDYSSNVTTNLKNHLHTHTGEKPFSCPLCTFSFATKDRLTTHIRTHTGEKPFQCSMCAYRSSRKDSLKNHMLTHQSHEKS